MKTKAAEDRCSASPLAGASKNSDLGVHSAFGSDVGGLNDRAPRRNCLMSAVQDVNNLLRPRLNFVGEQSGKATEHNQAGDQKDERGFSPWIGCISEIDPLLTKWPLKHVANSPKQINGPDDQSAPTGENGYRGKGLPRSEEDCDLTGKIREPRQTTAGKKQP